MLAKTTSVFFSRAFSPHPLTDAELESAKSTFGPFDAVIIETPDSPRLGEGYHMALDLLKGAEPPRRLFVQRLEHLARADHRGKRLGDLATYDIELVVVEPSVVLSLVPIAELGRYTTDLIATYKLEQNIRRSVTMKERAAAGAPLGRKPPCARCGHHKRTEDTVVLKNRLSGAPSSVTGHLGHGVEGDGRCQVEGCDCPGYE